MYPCTYQCKLLGHMYIPACTHKYTVNLLYMYVLEILSLLLKLITCTVCVCKRATFPQFQCFILVHTVVILLCCVHALAGSLRLYLSALLKFQSQKMVKVRLLKFSLSLSLSPPLSPPSLLPLFPILYAYPLYRIQHTYMYTLAHSHVYM